MIYFGIILYGLGSWSFFRAVTRPHLLDAIKGALYYACGAATIHLAVLT